MLSSVTLHEISSPCLPHPVPYAVLAPEKETSLPLCILLMGAGGSRDSLADLQPAFEQWWSEGSVPRMAIATPSGGMDYYLEESAGPLRWDSFLARDFPDHIRGAFPVGERTLVAGISGGGYGALKLAFAHPHRFAAVAAMQPMLEPGFREADVGPRNRLHHSAGGPAQLIGPGRDPELWEANNPANRARAHAQEIRESGLAIYIDAGDRDFLNAHDGAEFLHRALWDLDLPHEYHLVHGADHGGPTMRPRLKSMFAWFTSILHPAAVDGDTEKAAAAWLQAGMTGKPPAGATTTNAFIDFLRVRFEPLREQAAQSDSDTHRALGRL